MSTKTNAAFKPSPKFNYTKEDMVQIEKIIDRVMALEDKHAEDRRLGKHGTRRLAWMMDLIAAHNAVPLRLEELANADDFNLAHDAFGIHRHLNRETGELDNRFIPRYAKREVKSA